MVSISFLTVSCVPLKFRFYYYKWITLLLSWISFNTRYFPCGLSVTESMVVLASHLKILVRFLLWQVLHHSAFTQCFYLLNFHVTLKVYVCITEWDVFPFRSGASLLVYQLIIYHWVNKFLGPIISSRIGSVSNLLLCLSNKQINWVSWSSLIIWHSCCRLCLYLLSVHIPLWHTYLEPNFILLSALQSWWEVLLQ